MCRHEGNTCAQEQTQFLFNLGLLKGSSNYYVAVRNGD